MSRLQTIGFSLVFFVILTGGNCSRARVESMTHMNAGVAAARTGRYADAKESLERAIALDATNDQAFFNLAIVHMEMSEWEVAEEHLSRAISVNPAPAGYHEKLGTVRMQLEQWDRAKEAFEAAIAADANLFKAYFKLAQCLERLDDPHGALVNYTESARRGPRFIEAYIALGRLYADQGFPDLAIRVLRSGLDVAIPRTDEQAQLYHILGTIQQEQGNHAAAVESYRAALDILPGMPDALFSIGWTYALMDNREEAIRYLELYVANAGANAPEHYVRAAQTKLTQLQL